MTRILVVLLVLVFTGCIVHVDKSKQSDEFKKRLEKERWNNKIEPTLPK